MSGLKSRNKGRREEQQLVLALKRLGYKAERILRQYQVEGQPDVKTLEPEQYTFEMKSRRGSFKTIYALYDSEKDGDGVLRFVLDKGSIAVAVSTDFKNLLKTDSYFRNLALFPGTSKELRVYKRILSLKLLKQEADFLVLRDNNRPRLFIRYW